MATTVPCRRTISVNLLGHVWPFCHTNSLENDQKWPFSPLEIDLISLFLNVEKDTFYMDPMRGSCKLYPLQGIIKLDFLTFLAFEVRAFPKCPKMAIFSFSYY